MKLSEIKTVDEVLPFDIEVALTAHKNGTKVNLVDPEFGYGRKTLVSAEFTAAGDLDLQMQDADASYGRRNITYPASMLNAFRLDKNNAGELTLFVDEDKL